MDKFRYHTILTSMSVCLIVPFIGPYLLFVHAFIPLKFIFKVKAISGSRLILLNARMILSFNYKGLIGYVDSFGDLCLTWTACPWVWCLVGQRFISVWMLNWKLRTWLVCLRVWDRMKIITIGEKGCTWDLKVLCLILRLIPFWRKRLNRYISWKYLLVGTILKYHK